MKLSKWALAASAGLLLVVQPVLAQTNENSEPEEVWEPAQNPQSPESENPDENENPIFTEEQEPIETTDPTTGGYLDENFKGIAQGMFKFVDLIQ